MVRVFGPTDMDRRGATIAFYLLDPTAPSTTSTAWRSSPAEQRISVRTGCFCNPGDGEVAHDITRDDMAECFVGPRGAGDVH